MSDQRARCLICQGKNADADLNRVEVWADSLWRLTMSLDVEVLGFSYLEPKRHIPDVTHLDGKEAETFGPVLALVSRILREETGGELVYVYVFGDTVPHMHVHLAPHRSGALSTQIVRGELVLEQLPNGMQRTTSKQFPPLPEEQHRAIAARVRDRLVAVEASHRT